MLLLLPRLSVISASDWLEIFYSLCLIFLLYMLSFTIFNVKIPLGVELLSNTTNISQLSGKKLSRSNAYTSSLKIILILVNWFIKSRNSLRCSVTEQPFLYFKLTSFFIKNILFCGFFLLYNFSSFIQSELALVSMVKWWNIPLSIHCLINPTAFLCITYHSLFDLPSGFVLSPSMGSCRSL